MEGPKLAIRQSVRGKLQEQQEFFPLSHTTNHKVMGHFTLLRRTCPWSTP